MFLIWGILLDLICQQIYFIDIAEQRAMMLFLWVVQMNTEPHLLWQQKNWGCKPQYVSHCPHMFQIQHPGPGRQSFFSHPAPTSLPPATNGTTPSFLLATHPQAKTTTTPRTLIVSPQDRQMFPIVS